MEDLNERNRDLRCLVKCHANKINELSATIDGSPNRFTLSEIKKHLERIEVAMLELGNNISILAEKEEKKQESEELKEEALKKKAEEFHQCCLGNGKILIDCNLVLHDEWRNDLSFLKYVDHLKALKGVIPHKAPYVIRALIKIQHFYDILVTKGDEIIEFAAEALIKRPENHHLLETFCIIATTYTCTRTLYVNPRVEYFFKRLQERKELYEKKNLRDMMWLLKFFIHNDPSDGYIDDYFDFQYKEALLKDILGDQC
jgi:hypothetical protein